MTDALNVDLSLPPARRWAGLAPHADAVRAMTASYLQDLGGMAGFQGLVEPYRAAFVPEPYLSEVDAIAELAGLDRDEALVANLYYDAMRAILGCTAFALDTPSGPLHARNLDWWTERNMLSELTLLCNYQNGPAGPFTSVGWPGFVGVFSGVAEGRFAITLNASLSADPPALAMPVTLLLRQVFDTAKTFDDAVAILHDTPIAADCLLLVTGPRPAEMVVVERTSTRAALRTAANDLLVVTNDYRELAADPAEARTDALAATSCARFDRATYLALEHRPTRAADAFDVLRDPKVRMAITVQHMVMQAATGLLEVRMP